MKQQLAARDWPTVQHYANARTEIIQAILDDVLDEDEAAPR